ncbi:hypothetical protein GWI33_009742, partial [Rhynchophorus ferrugineus]
PISYHPIYAIGKTKQWDTKRFFENPELIKKTNHEDETFNNGADLPDLDQIRENPHAQLATLLPENNYYELYSTNLISAATPDPVFGQELLNGLSARRIPSTAPSPSTESPVRLQLDTEGSSSRREELGRISFPETRIPLMQPLGLLNTGVNTARKTAENVRNFASSQLGTLQDAARDLTQNFGLGKSSFKNSLLSGVIH